MFQVGSKLFTSLGLRLAEGVTSPSQWGLVGGLIRSSAKLSSTLDIRHVTCWPMVGQLPGLSLVEAQPKV